MPRKLVRTLICLLMIAAALAGQDSQKKKAQKRDWNRPFPAHKVIGNIYSIGTGEISTFLITGDQGHVLINSDFESTVPLLRANIEKLGFKMTDVKIILGSHAHGDHMEADAMLKELTGARVMAMEQDVPALRKMTPGGKAHPIDRVLKDGDEIKLGATTLKAHLTAGHTKGCTTFSMKTMEAGKSYDAVFVCSVGWNPGYVLWKNQDYPQIADDYRRSFQKLRSLHCDVFLAAHPNFYDMEAKYPKLGKGQNPYIDPAGYAAYIDLKEKQFVDEFERQKRENP
ncbi:MAG: subclass B3 metallo-beta-lactamase [Bryobacteraceae bacterium]